MKTHLPCSNCGSSDALTAYDTHTYCFSCNKRVYTNKDRQRVDTKKSFYQSSIKELPVKHHVEPPEMLRWLVRANLVELALKYGLFYSQDWDRVIIPAYDLDGELLGWQGRKIFEHTAGPKYLQGAGQKPILFYSKNCTPHMKQVYIVEDAASAMVLGEHVPTVALLGTNLDSNGIKLLRLLALSTNFILWLDDDGPGKEAANKLQKRLALVAECSIIKHKKEPKLCSAEDLIEAVSI